MNRKCIGILILAVGVLGSVMAFADGDSRPTTKGERDFSLKVLMTVAKALPRPFPGYEVTEATNINPYQRTTPGIEKGPFPVEFQATWYHRAKAEAQKVKEDLALQKAAQEMKAGPNKDQAALEKKQMSLGTALGAAITKNNTAEAQKIQAEMEVNKQKLDKIYAEQDKKLQASMQAAKEVGVTMRIDCQANQFWIASPAAKLVKDAPVAGIPVYRFEKQGQEDMTIALIGPWKEGGNASEPALAADKKPLPSLKVQTIEVRIQGDKATARRILEGTKWEAIQGLVK